MKTTHLRICDIANISDGEQVVCVEQVQLILRVVEKRPRQRRAAVDIVVLHRVVVEVHVPHCQGAVDTVATKEW